MSRSRMTSASVAGVGSVFWTTGMRASAKSAPREDVGERARARAP